MLGDCLVKCKNIKIDPEYTGKINCLKYLDFNSLYASAIIQALPTGEIRICDDIDYSDYSIIYIYTLEIEFNDELKFILSRKD